MKQINIKGLEKYSVDENGNVFKQNGKLRKTGLNKAGYVQLGFSNKGKRKYYRIHRIVALTYIPNPDNKPAVNHKDGNKKNNHVSNLEWCTASENNSHSTRILGNRNFNRTLFGSGQQVNHKRKIKVVKGPMPGLFESVQEAALANKTSTSYLSKVANNKVNSEKYTACYL